MDDKKKKFMIPEVETISFVEEDIITLSTGEYEGMGHGDNEEDYE